MRGGPKYDCRDEKILLVPHAAAGSFLKDGDEEGRSHCRAKCLKRISVALRSCVMFGHAYLSSCRPFFGLRRWEWGNGISSSCSLPRTAFRALSPNDRPQLTARQRLMQVDLPLLVSWSAHTAP